jgi:squalene cyclase
MAGLQRPSGRLGKGTEVNSQALLIIGLAAANRHVPRKVVKWLRNARCGDGGWAFDKPPGPNDDEHCKSTTDPDFVTSDSNSTANAIMALEATGRKAPSSAFAFLDTLRDDQGGGWGFTQDFSATDANSTSVVVQAYIAANRELPAGAMAGLKGLQFALCGKNGGAFDFTYGDDDSDGNADNDPPNLGATIAAVPALMKKSLPLQPTRVTKPVPPREPCN